MALLGTLGKMAFKAAGYGARMADGSYSGVAGNLANNLRKDGGAIGSAMANSLGRMVDKRAAKKQVINKLRSMAPNAASAKAAMHGLTPEEAIREFENRAVKSIEHLDTTIQWTSQDLITTIDNHGEQVSAAIHNLGNAFRQLNRAGPSIATKTPDIVGAAPTMSGPVTPNEEDKSSLWDTIKKYAPAAAALSKIVRKAAITATSFALRNPILWSLFLRGSSADGSYMDKDAAGRADARADARMYTEWHNKGWNRIGPPTRGRDSGDIAREESLDSWLDGPVLPPDPFTTQSIQKEDIRRRVKKINATAITFKADSIIFKGRMRRQTLAQIDNTISSMGGGDYGDGGSSGGGGAGGYGGGGGAESGGAEGPSSPPSINRSPGIMGNMEDAQMNPTTGAVADITPDLGSRGLTAPKLPGVTGSNIGNSDKDYQSPINSGTMLYRGHGRTSQYGHERGRLHAGADLYLTDPETGKLQVGPEAKVFSPTDGKITLIRKNRGKPDPVDGYPLGAGNYIEIEDKNGIKHRFLHTAEETLINPETNKPFKPGDEIKQGQQITYVDGSGTRFGQMSKRLGSVDKAVEHFEQKGWGSTNMPHLHFETRVNGRPVDPARFFPEMAKENKGAQVGIGRQPAVATSVKINPIVRGPGIGQLIGRNIQPPPPEKSDDFEKAVGVSEEEKTAAAGPKKKRSARGRLETKEEESDSLTFSQALGMTGEEMSLE